MVSAKKHSSAKAGPSTRSGKDKVCDAREYGEGLVGSRIRVWWPLDRKYYEGVVESYASSQKKHKVLYDDGDVEKLVMKNEKWELIDEADEISLKEESSDDDDSSDATPEALDRKKAKGNGNVSSAMPIKKRKIDAYTKSKSKARKVGDIEDEEETPKVGVKRSGRMGDIGGKVVAAASRMKSSKKVPESSNRKRGRTLSKKIKSESSSEETDTDDSSDEESKAKALKSSKKVPESSNGKQKKISSSSDSEGDEDTDEDSKPLASFLNKSPEAREALMEKLKEKKEKEQGEESSGNETEDGEE